MSEQVENVEQPQTEPVAVSSSRMSFEEFLLKGHETLKAGRKNKTTTKFGEFLSLPKSNKVRKLFLEVVEKKVAKELNMEGTEIDWSQIDFVVVWEILKKIIPLLLLFI